MLWTQVPDYTLLKCLGGGPLTCVYAARDGITDEDCAVKVLRPNLDDPATGVKLLQREARAGLSVRHPRLVRYRYAHVTCPPYFLVMDLLPGESLRRRLRRDYRMDWASAIWIARQTAEALDVLHQAGFVHGDVKPDNIRLVEDGAAMLIDLGFAHRPGENAWLFRRGYVLGTLDYLAPELCGDHPDADQSSDMFALGVTLFEMLTGQMPYPPGNLMETFRRHHCDPPADIRQCHARLPGALTQLVHRLLARSPAQRPRAAVVVQQLVDLEIAALRHKAA
ncbi:MAG: serine/threonine protein kinase [Gemmataceae bacterium]